VLKVPFAYGYGKGGADQKTNAPSNHNGPDGGDPTRTIRVIVPFGF
jgi:hypothetical protein